MGSLANIVSTRRRGRDAFFAIAALLVLWTLAHYKPSLPSIDVHDAKPYIQSAIDRLPGHQRISTQDLSHVEKHIRTPTFTYARRVVHTKESNEERPELTVVQEALFGKPQVFQKDNLTAVTLDSLLPIDLRVPSSPKVKKSILSFGISTPVKRLEHALPQLMHWLPGTGCPLHVIAEPSPEDLKWQHKIRAMDINLTITNSQDTFAHRYFSIIKELYDARSPETEWLVLIDDDTFFPSLDYLVHHLKSNYHSDREVMIAATTDNIKQIHTFGLLPFGGGGIFFSVPLARRLVQPHIWKLCMDIENSQGDQIVNHCLNEYTPIRPSFDLGLHQMDINGDPSGYFESGRRMLSIHHWRTWFNVDIPMAANVSKSCGNECVFQRWQFKDNVVLSNGYSIIEYPDGIFVNSTNHRDVDLEKMEMSWEGNRATYIHHAGPLRDKVSQEQKIQYRLVEAVVLPGEGVRQVYLKKAEWMGGQDEDVGNVVAMDQVIEIFWEGTRYLPKEVVSGGKSSELMKDSVQ